MNSSNVQRVYEEHVAALSGPERLRLVELITRDLAPPATQPGGITVENRLMSEGTWQPIDHRGDLSEWRDRVL